MKFKELTKEYLNNYLLADSYIIHPLPATVCFSPPRACGALSLGNCLGRGEVSGKDGDYVYKSNEAPVLRLAAQRRRGSGVQRFVTVLCPFGGDDVPQVNLDVKRLRVTVDGYILKK